MERFVKFLDLDPIQLAIFLELPNGRPRTRHCGDIALVLNRVSCHIFIFVRMQ